MQLSMFEAAVPPLKRTLGNLHHILTRARNHAESHRIDPAVLLACRLYPDMFPLSRQVQIASDLARRGVARLAGTQAPKVEDDERSFEDLSERLEHAIAYLERFRPDQIDGSEDREVVVPIGRGETITMKGWPFLSTFVLPNVYFHVTTAYDLLRHNGVPLGKLDFLGQP
jgi:hypothetical protein